MGSDGCLVDHVWLLVACSHCCMQTFNAAVFVAICSLFSFSYPPFLVCLSTCASFYLAMQSPTFRPQGARYCYGNYDMYYGYRHGGVADDVADPRLKLLKREWFEGKACLDIGSNTGQVCGRELHSVCVGVGVGGCVGVGVSVCVCVCLCVCGWVCLSM